MGPDSIQAHGTLFHALETAPKPGDLWSGSFRHIHAPAENKVIVFCGPGGETLPGALTDGNLRILQLQPVGAVLLEFLHVLVHAGH